MKITDIVGGLAAGVGIDLSPDEKTAYYVEWSIGELSKVEIATGNVEKIKGGLKYPEDVEVDWNANELFISQRTGEIIQVSPGGRSKVIATPGGAPSQLALVSVQGKRYLYTVTYDSGLLLRIDLATQAVTVIMGGLGHPVGLAIDQAVKYAYVTEQDKSSLTRIDIQTGQSLDLYTGLVAPFFLAWNENASGIFCVERDPSNSLLLLDVTTTQKKVVASGLAWRPSGVAPNKDDSRIYICADQKLQVISFDGVPTIKPGPLPFEIHSILFNYDKSEAIPLKDPATDAYVHAQPEWVRGSRNEPAAYVRGKLPHIKVVFRKLQGFVAGKYAVGAVGNLGGIRRKEFTPSFSPSGLSPQVDFELMWPLPGAIGKHEVSFEWYARPTAAPSVPTLFDTTKHTLCTTWQPITPNSSQELEKWVYKQPMLWTSEWAADKNNEKDICDAIITNLHKSGLKYGIFGVWDIRHMLNGTGGMCGGWYMMFPHMAHCQGVFVDRRFYEVDPRSMANGETKWRAIVIRSGGLNQPQPTSGAATYNDVNAQYPINPSTQVVKVTENRYRFSGPGDGHCINFLRYNQKVYLYDPSFGAGPFEISPFASADGLPPIGSNIGGLELASFKQAYLNGAVDYMEGMLHDPASTLRSLTIKTLIIPDLLNGVKEITFNWSG
jgi:hypothetical protein